MILLDTHIWIWWLSEPARLIPKHRRLLEAAQQLSVSIISCWEVAKLVEYKRLQLDRNVERWIDDGLRGIELVALSPRIVVESTCLPEPFHRDPADQLLVATARVLQCPLMTLDAKIASYAHVQLA